MVRSARTLTRGLLACTVAAFGLGCGVEAKKPRTELLLVADTDIAELERISFEVSARGRDTETQGGDVRADGEPLSVGVVRETGPMGPITVVARGFVADSEVISRSSIVWFAAGKTLVVPLHLLASCQNVSCEADQTCTEDGCRPRALDIDDLTEWTGSTPSLPGGGDASDAGPDDLDGGENIEPGGRRDAGIDAQVAEDADLPPDDVDIDDVDAGELDASDLPDAQDPPHQDAGDAGSAGDSGVVFTSCGAAGSFDLKRDPNHCGSCGTVCDDAAAFYYYTPICTQGVCGFKCTPLHANCDDLTLINGCETPVATDRYNCGACNRVCATGQTCVAGACTP